MVVCRSLKETFSYSHRLLVVSVHLNRADRKQAGVLRQVLIYLISFSWFFPAPGMLYNSEQEGGREMEGKTRGSAPSTLARPPTQCDRGGANTHTLT